MKRKTTNRREDSKRRNGKNSSGKNDEPQKVPFGRVLRQMRISREISLKGLADALGFSSAYLCDIEFSRRKPPSSSVVLKIAQELQVNPRKLIEAAAEERGVLDFEINNIGPDQKELAILLSCAWKNLNSQHIGKIEKIIDPAIRDTLKFIVHPN